MGAIISSVKVVVKQALGLNKKLPERPFLKEKWVG